MRISYRKIWLYLLPLLFLPNMGLAQATSFGVLKISDFIIGPYIIVLYLSRFRAKNKVRLFKNELQKFLVLFLFWMVFSTLCASLLNNYPTDSLVFSILKIGKLSLYTVAALLTISAMSHDETNRQLNWSLLVSLLVMSISLLINRFVLHQDFNPVVNSQQYYADNIVSATMAILFAYLLALMLSGHGSKSWRIMARICLLISIFGVSLSNGRGGWVAMIASSIFVFSRLKMKRTIAFLLICILASSTAYLVFPQFKDQVDRTISPDASYVARYDTDLMGIETGARWRYLKKEGSKVFDSPVFGSGFFHRGGETGLDPVGSHNFFVQMFLEGGFVGGILTITIFIVMWHQASRQVAVLVGAELAAKAAILSAFVVGLSGEYFYGGMVLFTLLLSYGIVGRLPAHSKLDTRN